VAHFGRFETILGRAAGSVATGDRKLTENREVYLSALRRHRAGDEAGFPWSVPVVASLKVLEFTTPVTFFVGENGSGKSTVLEGIAAGMRAIAVGSVELDKDDTLQAARQFAAVFRFERRQQPRTKLLRVAPVASIRPSRSGQNTTTEGAWPTSRRRFAPSARRIASSPSRADVCTSSRLAMFAHAMSSTNAGPP
jgi:hypothetical protein